MTNTTPASPPVHKWGALASFVLAPALVAPWFIYLSGNLQSAGGPLAYSVADVLYGPVSAAALLVAVFALREQLSEHAPRRMSLAFVAAALAAGAIVAVACIRASNRNYHLVHPELNLESSQTILIVWATLVAGITGAAWHFLGWTMLLVGSVGWTSGRLPRLLSALYLAAGAIALFAFIRSGVEITAMWLTIVISIWQGIWLLRSEPAETRAPAAQAS